MDHQRDVLSVRGHARPVHQRTREIPRLWAPGRAVRSLRREVMLRSGTIGVVQFAKIPRAGGSFLTVVAGVAMWLAASRPVSADERDLHSGLAYLRAGAQAQAEQHLARYLDEERDPQIRRVVARVLPLLKTPLTQDVREYL